MENNSNGIAWFGDVYQKLETMCLEAEEVVWKEGFKYVEDQVQTVGENVKQFCTEFVREMLPESILVDNAVSDPPEFETSDGVNQMSIKSMDKDTLENQRCEETVSVEANLDERINHAPDVLPLEEQMTSLIPDKFETSMVEKYSEVKQLNLEVSEKVAEEDNGESIPDIPSLNSAVLDECLEHRFLGIKSPSDSASTRLTGKSEDAIDVEHMTVDSTTLMQLDGSCILVNGLEFTKLSTEARPRSFKKKVGSALRIGRRSAKRHCSEPDLRPSEGVCKTVSSSSIVTIQCEESSDSDWEII